MTKQGDQLKRDLMKPKLFEVIDENTAGGGGSAVASFNGRVGDVLPESGDYTPELVGAIPTEKQEQYDAYDGLIAQNSSDLGFLAGEIIALKNNLKQLQSYKNLRIQLKNNLYPDIVSGFVGEIDFSSFNEIVSISGIDNFDVDNPVFFKDFSGNAIYTQNSAGVFTGTIKNTNKIKLIDFGLSTGGAIKSSKLSVKLAFSGTWIGGGTKEFKINFKNNNVIIGTNIINFSGAGIVEYAELNTNFFVGEEFTSLANLIADGVVEIENISNDTLQNVVLMLNLSWEA